MELNRKAKVAQLGIKQRDLRDMANDVMKKRGIPVTVDDPSLCKAIRGVDISQPKIAAIATVIDAILDKLLAEQEASESKNED